MSAKNGEANGGKELFASRLENDHYDLIPEGVEQIDKVAKKIKKEGGLDFIYSSPFLRAKHSAEIVGQELGIEVVIDGRLKEIDGGSIREGKELAVYDDQRITDFET